MDDRKTHPKVSSGLTLQWSIYGFPFFLSFSSQLCRKTSSSLSGFVCPHSPPTRDSPVAHTMVAFKYAVITTGLSACAGAVASGLCFSSCLTALLIAADHYRVVVHKRPIAKGCDVRGSASVIADMPRTTEFDTPSPTSFGTANHLQRPLARSIYWSTNTASGSKLSSRAFVMPPHANLVASATALAASTISLVIDLVHSALSLALELGGSAISSAATWALSHSSSISAVNKSDESHADASATTTLLGSAVAYAMSIVGPTFVGAKIAALASTTSQLHSARSTALALHTSALSSANAILDSALSSASALKGTAVATATNLDEAALSSAAAILSSALSAAAVLIPSTLASPTSAAFVLEKSPQAREAAMQSVAHSSGTSLLAWAVNSLVRPVLADVASVISWIRGELLADSVPAPTPTRTVVASHPVPT